MLFAAPKPPVTISNQNAAFYFLPVKEYDRLKAAGQIVTVREKDEKPGAIRVGKYKLSKPRRK